MGQLRWLGPLLFLFLLFSNSEALRPSRCRTTDISYEEGPIDIFMESEVVESASCAYTVKYNQSGGHVDCGSNISISITGGKQTCGERLVGEEKELRCNCRWEKCIDDIIEDLRVDSGSAICLLAIKDTFDKERRSVDSLVHKSYYDDPPPNPPPPPPRSQYAVEIDHDTQWIIVGVGCGIFLIVIAVPLAIVAVVKCCCRREEQIPPPMPPMAAMGPMGPMGPMMGGPLAPLPVAQVAAPPASTEAYPRFNNHAPHPMRAPLPMAQVGAPPPGNSAYPHFNPNERVPSENYQGPVNAEQGGSAMNHRRMPSNKNSGNVTPRQGYSKQGSNQIDNGSNMSNQMKNVSSNMNPRRGHSKQGSNKMENGTNISNDMTNGPDQ